MNLKKAVQRFYLTNETSHNDKLMLVVIMILLHIKDQFSLPAKIKPIPKVRVSQPLIPMVLRL